MATKLPSQDLYLGTVEIASSAGTLYQEGVAITASAAEINALSGSYEDSVFTNPQINDTTADHQYVVAVSELAADRTVTLPLLGAADEFVFKDHAVTLANKTLTSPVLTTPQINDTSADHQYVFAVSELASDRTVTLPLLTGNDEFVFKAHTQTLTNKTLTAPTLTSAVITGATISSLVLNDGHENLDITVTNQTDSGATITIPDIVDSADTMVLCDLAQTLTNKTITMPDDTLLTLGTTTATAATKITAEFDETTTGIGVVNMGSLAAPMVLNTNPGATVVGETINILHSAGAGDCDDLIGAYVKCAVSGDGDSGTTVVGHASRAYVGTAAESTTVASQLYGSQPWVSHYGTGAVTAMSGLSAKCDVNTGNFTATTVNAGHFHVEGASTVTSSMFDGVMIEVYPDVTCLDAGLRIAVDTGATVGAAIAVDGATTDFVKFAATGAGGATTADPTVGSANCWIKCHVGNTITWLIGYADS
jgi:hypothetical protein